MPEERKLKKMKEKKLEKSEVKVSAGENTDLQKVELIEQIKKAVTGLYYISETDAEILPFAGEKAESVSREAILSQTENAVNSPVEERNFAGLFTRLTENQDWFGDEEIETAKKFVRLKELLEKNLRDLKVFKIGKINLEVYIVGLDAENNLMGVKTKALET